MKKILLLFLLSGTLSYSQNLQWSDTVIVNSSVFGNTRPRISLINDSIPAVSWGNFPGKEIYFSKMNSQGKFDIPVRISVLGESTYIQDWTSHEMAVSGDSIYIVYKNEPLVSAGSYLVRSLDGGMTFSDTIRIDPPSSFISFLPTVDVKADGNPVVSYMENNSDWSDPRFVVLNSNDAGTSFTSPVNASKGISPAEVCDCCPATILAHDSLQFMLYRNNNSNVRTMWATVSSNFGASFSQGVMVDNTGSVSAACQSTGPSAIVNGDSLWTVWRSTTGGKTRIYLSSTSISDLQVGSHFRISDVANSSIQNYPRIKGNANVAGVVWQESLLGNIDIIFSYTEDAATSFLQKRDTVNIYRSGIQMNPDIAIDKNNNFHIVWQDDASGTVVYRKGSLSTVLGINENADSKLQVFPNPTSGKFTVQLNQAAKDGKIRVYNILGNCVLTQQINSSFNQQLDLSGQAKGIYFVEVRSGETNETRKIIIQ
jgi:hypothetical protein